MATDFHYSQKSIDFIVKAALQKKSDWLDKNRDEYEEVLVQPTKEIITNVAKALQREAPGYRFPNRQFAERNAPAGPATIHKTIPGVHRDTSRDVRCALAHSGARCAGKRGRFFRNLGLGAHGVRAFENTTLKEIIYLRVNCRRKTAANEGTLSPPGRSSKRKPLI